MDGRRHQPKIRLLVLSVALTALAVLAACGGGGADTQGNVPTSTATPPPPPPAPLPSDSPQPTAPLPLDPAPLPFTIQSTDPVDRAARVNRASTFAATFSAQASAVSVTSETVQLSGPQGNVIATNATSSGAEVMISPAAGALPGDTTYTITFSSTIEDIAGRRLTGERSKSFTTAPSAWRPTVIDVAEIESFESSSTVAIASAASGDLLLAWSRRSWNFASATLYVAQVDAVGGGVVGPIELQAITDGSVGGESLTCSSTGDCYLAWLDQRIGGHQTARLARFVVSSGTWDLPIAVPFAGVVGSILSVKPNVGHEGNVTVLATTSSQVLAVRFDVASQSWGPQNTYALSASTLEIHAAMDTAGNIVAAWIHAGQGTRWVYGIYYSASSGRWSSEQPIDDQLNTSMRGSMVLGLHDTNAATVVFSRGGFISQVNASHLNPVTGIWGPSIRLDDVDSSRDSAHSPMVIGDAIGHVTVVWRQNSGL